MAKVDDFNTIFVFFPSLPFCLNFSEIFPRKRFFTQNIKILSTNTLYYNCTFSSCQVLSLQKSDCKKTTAGFQLFNNIELKLLYFIFNKYATTRITHLQSIILQACDITNSSLTLPLLYHASRFFHILRLTTALKPAENVLPFFFAF